MKILKKLWADEVGVVMSAETVMLGTIGVLAMTAGVGTMSTAVNSELGELGKAFRGFDQSFSTPGFQTSFGGSSGAGISGAAGQSGTRASGYTQPPAAISQAQLDIQMTQQLAVENELAGRVIQRLDAAQLEQLRQYSELQLGEAEL